jgi:CDP-diacylglycerol--serine O-phosphatidyltransferase
MEAFDLEPKRIDEMRWVAWGLAVFAGLTMVSNVRFYSGKDINLRKAVPFSVVVLIALFVVILSQVADNVPEMLFTLFAIYAASGYVMWMVNRFQRRTPRPPPPAVPPDGL